MRRLIGACLFMLALLWWLGQGHAIATVPIAEAPLYEGQSVRVEGATKEVRDGTGWTRFAVVDDGHGLVVRAGFPSRLAEGQWVELTGSLRRIDGELVLWLDEPSDVRILAAPSLPRVSIEALARNPAAWQDTPVEVRANVRAGTLQGDLVQIRTGDGLWVDGRVEARGRLGYEAGCGCYQFHASSVRPWTS